MFTQKVFVAIAFVLSTASFNVSAAIMNHVDDPAECVQVKEKVYSVVNKEQVTASAKTNK